VEIGLPPSRPRRGPSGRHRLPHARGKWWPRRAACGRKLRRR
jgi:hypothetical protein